VRICGGIRIRQRPVATEKLFHIGQRVSVSKWSLVDFHGWGVFTSAETGDFLDLYIVASDDGIPNLIQTGTAIMHATGHIPADPHVEFWWRCAAESRVEADKFLQPKQRDSAFFCNLGQGLPGQAALFVLNPHHFAK
jgi:hypothetical protein